MTTTPSRPAQELAARLADDGFDVTGALVQRWRERHLLGDWLHRHDGGPGSRAVPPPGAYERARLCARLSDPHRTRPIVTLLAVLADASVTVKEVQVAVATLLLPVVTRLDGAGEPGDRADAFLAALTARRSGRAALAGKAQALADTPDPRPIGGGHRASYDRAYDTVASALEAFAGDGSSVWVHIEDALRLEGLVVDDLDIGGAAGLAAFEEEMTNAASRLGDIPNQLSQLTEADLDNIARSRADEVAAFIASTDPIVDPFAVLRFLIGFVCFPEVPAALRMSQP